MTGDHEKKSDRVRVHHDKKRWGELTMRRNDGVRVYHNKKSDGVRVDHEKKSDGMRVRHEKKQRWGES